MSDDTRLYIAVESNGGRLVVDGPMRLWRQLVDSFGRAAPEDRPDERRSVVAAGRTSEEER